MRVEFSTQCMRMKVAGTPITSVFQFATHQYFVLIRQKSKCYISGITQTFNSTKFSLGFQMHNQTHLPSSFDLIDALEVLFGLQIRTHQLISVPHFSIKPLSVARHKCLDVVARINRPLAPWRADFGHERELSHKISAHPWFYDHFHVWGSLCGNERVWHYSIAVVSSAVLVGTLERELLSLNGQSQNLLLVIIN